MQTNSIISINVIHNLKFNINFMFYFQTTQEYDHKEHRHNFKICKSFIYFRFHLNLEEKLQTFQFHFNISIS